MPRCIAFLRAVNVGGRFIKMESLRAEFEALGLARVETFIASGNVIFETRARDLDALALTIESHLAAAFGFEMHTFVRTTGELDAITRHEAFDAGSAARAATFVVGFLSAVPDSKALQSIAAFETAHDRFHVHRRELYWLSQHKQSESTFSNAVLERALRMRSTFRGMSTLRKLSAKHPPDA